MSSSTEYIHFTNYKMRNFEICGEIIISYGIKLNRTKNVFINLKSLGLRLFVILVNSIFL